MTHATLQMSSHAGCRNCYDNDEQFIWPGFRHVFGKPRRPNVQGAVERVNREIAKAVMCWIAQHGSLKWTCAIGKLQYWLNQRPNTRMKGTVHVTGSVNAVVYRWDERS